MGKILFAQSKVDKFLYLCCAITLVVLCVFSFFTHVLAASTNVSNSISVSSSGDGVARSDVRTVINGEIIEDYHFEGNGIVDTHVESRDGATTTHTLNSTADETAEELAVLLEKLKILMHYYVLLLNTIS